MLWGTCAIPKTTGEHVQTSFCDAVSGMMRTNVPCTDNWRCWRYTYCINYISSNCCEDGPWILEPPPSHVAWCFPVCLKSYADAGLQLTSLKLAKAVNWTMPIQDQCMQFPAIFEHLLGSVTCNWVTPIIFALFSVMGNPRLASFSLPVMNRFSQTYHIKPPAILSVGNFFDTPLQHFLVALSPK